MIRSIAALTMTGLLATTAIPQAAAAGSADGAAESPDPSRVERLVLDRAAGRTRVEPSRAPVASAPAPSTAAGLEPCMAPTAAAVADRVELSWVPWSTLEGVTSYRLWRTDPWDSTPDWTVTLPATARGYVDRRATPGSPYVYHLQAYTASGPATSSGDCWSGAGLVDEDVVAAVAPGEPGDPYTPAAFGLVQKDLEQFHAATTLRRDANDRFTPAYSADGRWIAYAADDGTSFDLWVTRADGRGTPRRLTTTAEVSELEPAWAPDGQTIAYTAVTHAETAVTLRLVTVATGVSRVLSSRPTSHAAFTPGGTAVIATDLTAETAPLARIMVATGAYSAVKGTEGGYDPDVSRAGALAYVVATDTEVTLRRTTAAGGTSAPVVSLAGLYEDLWWPRWSPTGTRLVWLQTDGTRDRLWSALSGGAPVAAGDFNEPDTAYVDSFDIRRRPAASDSSDFTGDGHGDVLARTSSGALYLYPSNRNTGFAARRLVSTAMATQPTVVAAGDLTSDGHADLVTRGTDGLLWIYAGNGNVVSASSWRPRSLVGSGWNRYNALIAPGDWSGDGRADLIGRDSAGYVWMHEGTGTTGSTAFRARRRINTGWAGFTAIVGAGDFDNDAAVDLIARDRYGALWLFPGNGAGGFRPRRQVGGGWHKFNAIVGTGNFSLGDPVDLVVRSSDGTVRLYPTVDGRITPSHVLATGWNGFTAITG